MNTSLLIAWPLTRALAMQGPRICTKDFCGHFYHCVLCWTKSQSAVESAEKWVVVEIAASFQGSHTLRLLTGVTAIALDFRNITARNCWIKLLKDNYDCMRAEVNCPLHSPPANSYITFRNSPLFTSAIVIFQQSLLPLGSFCYSRK